MTAIATPSAHDEYFGIVRAPDLARVLRHRLDRGVRLEGDSRDYGRHCFMLHGLPTRADPGDYIGRHRRADEVVITNLPRPGVAPGWNLGDHDQDCDCVEHRVARGDTSFRDFMDNFDAQLAQIRVTAAAGRVLNRLDCGITPSGRVSFVGRHALEARRGKKKGRVGVVLDPGDYVGKHRPTAMAYTSNGGGTAIDLNSFPDDRCTAGRHRK